jgi:succinate dehydrogenase/fumarate reductase flavoprotein subunit
LEFLLNKEQKVEVLMQEKIIPERDDENWLKHTFLEAK